jgi:hypothetical protein
MDLLGRTCPRKSALRDTAAKLNAGFWNRVLKATSGIDPLVAIDSTGLTRSNPSYHYLRRIDGRMPKIGVKLSVALGTRRKKYRAARIRIRPAADIRDASYLMKHGAGKVTIADKAYSAEWLYHQAHEQGTLLMVPPKRNVRKGFYRKKMLKLFRLRTYHRREMVESGNSAIKRKYGGSVSSRSVRTIRTEVYCRLACNNLFSWLARLSGQSRISGARLQVRIISGFPTSCFMTNKTLAGGRTHDGDICYRP